MPDFDENAIDADAIGQPDTTAEAQPVEEADQRAPEPSQTQTAPTPEGERTSTPVEKFKYRGREYTLDELRASGVLNDVLTTAEQFPHLQKKYTDTLESMRGAKEPTPQQPQVSPADVLAQARARHAQTLKAVGEQKVFGEQMADFVETWPDVYTMTLHELDLSRQREEDLHRRLAALEQDSQSRSVQGGVQVFESALDGLPADPDFSRYGDAVANAIKNPEVREQIRNRVIELYGNQPLSSLGPEHVKQAAITVLWSGLTDGPATTTRTARSRASGAGGAARPETATGKPSKLEQEFKELDEA